MRTNKIIASLLLIVMLGLISLNIPLIAFACLEDIAYKKQVQDYSVLQNSDAEPVMNDSIINENVVPAAYAASTVSKSTEAKKSYAPSWSSTTRSSNNLDSLARLVYGEARGESFDGQVAIAAVVLNRVESDNFGNTVNEVIFEPGAFTAVSDGQYYLKPDDSAYRAAQAALDGWDPTYNAIYYWNPVTATNKWVWSRPITITIGKHVFAN